MVALGLGTLAAEASEVGSQAAEAEEAEEAEGTGTRARGDVGSSPRILPRCKWRT